jgi:hypothetical protein
MFDSDRRPKSVFGRREVLLAERRGLEARRAELVREHGHVVRRTLECRAGLERMRAVTGTAVLKLAAFRAPSHVLVVVPAETLEALTVLLDASTNERLIESELAELDRTHRMLHVEAAHLDARFAENDAAIERLACEAVEPRSWSPGYAENALRN